MMKCKSEMTLSKPFIDFLQKAWVTVGVLLIKTKIPGGMDPSPLGVTRDFADSDKQPEQPPYLLIKPVSWIRYTT